MAGGLPGWLAEGKTWSTVFHANLRPQSEVEVGNYDDVIRHLITETGDDAGWTIKSEGAWVTEPLTHVKVALQGALGLGTEGSHRDHRVRGVPELADRQPPVPARVPRRPPVEPRCRPVPVLPDREPREPPVPDLDEGPEPLRLGP